MESELSGDFQFDGSTSWYDLTSLHASSDNHDSIIERTLSFSDELFSTTSKNDSSTLGVRASLEKIESFSTNLDFFEVTA